MSPILGIYASQISGHLFTLSGSYDALASVTVPSGGLSSITFAGIPTGYSHLQIRYIAAGATGNNIFMTANGDSTTSNYHAHILAGTGSSAVAVNLGNTAGFQVGFNGLGSGSYFYAGVIDLLEYGSTVKNKTVRVLGGADANGSGEMDLISGVWMNSGSAVTSLNLSAISSFVQYSSFALYGVK
jgi:hypothetical protein